MIFSDLGLIYLHRSRFSFSQADSKPLSKNIDTEHILQELDMAKKVQEGLLSLENPHIPGIQIAKRCQPASSVGGDFYTFIDQTQQQKTRERKSRRETQ